MHFLSGRIVRRGAALAVAFVVMLAVGQTATAQTESVLYTFCSQTNCADGAQPVAGLIMDKKGNLYGTTVYGGANNGGTVFEVSNAQVETVLYSFCSLTSCMDGKYPYAGLIMDKKGNLYGTTQVGGYGGGVAFEVSPPAKKGGAWTEKVLYYFCTLTNCEDGTFPYAGLIMDKEGNLYGTTFGGGTGGYGTVFELVNSSGSYRLNVLYSFTGENGDGANPEAGLIMDSEGNFYGTTTYGGNANQDGIVFRFTPGLGEDVIYTFCSSTNCADGARPAAGLIMDKDGNLYGTTMGGGAYGYGTVFELLPYPALYSFDGDNGSDPQAGLLMDSEGNLYGTTVGGGASGVGTVFTVFKGPFGYTEQIYSFESKPGCADGANPRAGLIMDKEGRLYGTTQGGCTNSQGTVFMVTP